MQFQFYRLYLFIIVAASVVVWSFSEILDSVDSTDSHYHISVDYLFDAFENINQKDADNGKPMPQFSYVAIEKLALPDNLTAMLEQGQSIAIVDDAQRTYYYKKSAVEGKVLQLGPMVEQTESGGMFLYLVLLFYSCLALLLLALIRPVFKDLQVLQHDADKFGRKPVAMQTKIKSSSNIFPLAKAFNRMSSKIVDFIEMNKDLSRIISHEIRTPLTRMKFMLKMIAKDIDNEQQQLLTSDIHEIELLVNDYLSFSKVEAQFSVDGRQDHSMEGFLKQMEQKFKVYADDFDIQFEAQDEIAFFNTESLSLATQNLITNALRYAEHKIIIRFNLIDGVCVLSVEDDGPGLLNDGKGLEQAFARVEDNDSNFKGFGLGLYIVKKVSALHEGDFTMTGSEELGGAKMILNWPDNRSLSLNYHNSW